MTTTRRAGRELAGHSRNGEIGTPDALYKRLDRMFIFDYDAAAAKGNAKTRVFSTVSGTFGLSARDGRALVAPYLTRAQCDGLRFPWRDRRVFCNPPYESPTFEAFINKAIAERNDAAVIVLLIKYDPSTIACQRLALFADIQPLPRLQYKGMSQPATFASAIAVLRPDWDEKRSPFGLVRPLLAVQDGAIVEVPALALA